MTCLRIEICKNFRGKYNIRIGDLDGSSESSNLTYEEIIDELKTEIKEALLFDGIEESEPNSQEEGCKEVPQGQHKDDVVHSHKQKVQVFNLDSPDNIHEQKNKQNGI